MTLDPDICYKALAARDPRFDGRFFVAVGSTGIYCRSVCTAKTPRRESCTFHRSAAAAERAGYRPCMRCRPELAPGSAPVDAAGRLAAAAAERIEDNALGEMSVARLAAELGVSDRHLRRVMEREYGVSPIELAQTQRLLMAKRLLTDTRMPVGEVAFASGFASLRRFNALFTERYRLSPTALRRSAGAAGESNVLVCELGYRPPLDWPAMLRFLRHRATRGVEVVSADAYSRTVAIGKHRGWVTVVRGARPNSLRVEVPASLAPVLAPLLARVKRLFDLGATPAIIEEHLGELARARPGLRVPGCFGGFEMAVRAILGQQVSVQGATTLAGRFAEAFGEPIETPVPGLTHLAPTAARVASARVEEIAAIGIPRARAASMHALAMAVASGQVVLDRCADPVAAIYQLQQLPGIGEWTAQYVAMRALGWPDAFPHTDLGVRKALGMPTPKQALEMAEAWRPWRAYAVMHLWASLEENP